MKRISKNVLMIGLVSAAVLTFSACDLIKSLDVIAKQSVASFEKLIEKIPTNVTADEIYGGWSLTSPDNSARFIWSEDYSKSPLYDVMLELDAKPFINAGLNTEKLPPNYKVVDDLLIVGTKLGNDKLEYNEKATPIASYKHISKLYRDNIGYHAEFDHFGVDLGNGNMFEWAKDLIANDKDIVFVLNPEPLINAGVNPEKVEGWVFTKVSVHMSGELSEVDKFLKPFEL